MVLVSKSKKDKVKTRGGYTTIPVTYYILLSFLVLDFLYAAFNYQDIFFPLTWNNDYSPKKGPCAPRKGVVIVSMLDVLEFNLLQISFGRQLADELCWDFFLRPHWNVGFGSKERGCFAKVWNSQTNLNGTYHSMQEDIRSALKFEPNPWNYMNSEWSNANTLLQGWAKNLSIKSEAWTCFHPNCIISSSSIANTLQDIRSKDSLTNTIFLEAFFVQHEWLQHWRPSLRQWLSIEPSCCSLPPPTDETVVIHLKLNEPFSKIDRRVVYLDVRVEEYQPWLEKYHLNDKPLLIVCDLGCKESTTVKKILKLYPLAQVVSPADRVDTVCVLSQAKTLLVTPNDFLSSVAASMTHPSSKIHYFTHPVGKTTSTTLALPDWTYHEVENGVITNWEVPYKKFEFQ